MTEHNAYLEELRNKMELLLSKQHELNQEVRNLQSQVEHFKTSAEVQSTVTEESKPPQIEVKQKAPEIISVEPHLLVGQPYNNPSPSRLNLEKIIGENLINKVGIVITIIGVAIGVKYSIEHQLLSPLTRIIAGYFAGVLLLGTGIKLKKNYENYSGVLVSGAMTIMYFITYAAYSFYDLLPQSVSFVMMLVFTVFTVLAAFAYNRQIIAHIGLVGAYAVPFLLSPESGKPEILFGYMTIINFGILAIAYKRYWKPLYYFSFALTWIIFSFWYVNDYEVKLHLHIALIFLSAFFTLFYLIFFVYKLRQKEEFLFPDITLLLVNSFIFFGIGMAILKSCNTSPKLLGVFTMANAAVHFLVSMLMLRFKSADRNLFYMVFGLMLVYITLTIPVTLDGSWVTVLWAGEGALLFRIGRTKDKIIYEKISFALMALALISLIQDWHLAYGNFMIERPEEWIKPFFNISFLGSVLFIAAFIFVFYTDHGYKRISGTTLKTLNTGIISFSLLMTLILVVYFTFRLEISNYCHQQHTDKVHLYRLTYIQSIWIINFSMLYILLVALLNLFKLKSSWLGLANMGFIIVVLAIFLSQGLFALSEIRDLPRLFPDSHYRTWIPIIRYISLAMVIPLLLIGKRYTRQDFMLYKFEKEFDFVLYVVVLWIASSELLNWMDLAGSKQSYKLGLSILWGLYSLFMIIMGIWKGKKYLRLGAFVLLGSTLLKLFFYDISYLNLISRAILLIALGVLSLIISFLYNKYKHIITDN